MCLVKTILIKIGFKVHVHKRFLGRGIAERRDFFPEIAEKIRESVSTVFNKNVGVLATLNIIELKIIT